MIYWESNTSYRRIYRNENDWSQQGAGGDVQFSTGDTITHFGPIRFFNDQFNFDYKYAINANMVGTSLKVYATNCDGTTQDESFSQTFSNAIELGGSAYRIYPMTNCISLIRRNANSTFDIRFYPYSGNNWDATVLRTSSVPNTDYFYYDDPLINANSKYICNNNALYVTGIIDDNLKTIILTPDINDDTLNVSSTTITTTVNANEIYGMKYYTNHGFVANMYSDNVYITKIDNLYSQTPTISDEQLTTVNANDFGANPQILFNYRGNKYIFNSPDNGLTGQLLHEVEGSFVVNESNNAFQNNSGTLILDVTMSDQPVAPVFMGVNGNTTLNGMLYASDFGPMINMQTMATDGISLGSVSFKTDDHEFFSESSITSGTVYFNKYTINAYPPVKADQRAYTDSGVYTFTIPPYVFSFSAVAIGGGGGGGGSNGVSGPAGCGGGGGELRYLTSVNVNPGSDVAVTVGSGGTGGSSSGTGFAGDGGLSRLVYNSVTILQANGGDGGQNNSSVSTTPGGSGGIGDGGGNGGNGGMAPNNLTGGGGGGAGGYSGNGGKGQGASVAGSPSASDPATNGSGGGGAGGLAINSGGSYSNGCGGGVGIFGEGTSGTTGNATTVGGSNAPINPTTTTAGFYGGGGAGIEDDTTATGLIGGGGAVRIIWGGENRAYPSTNTADQ